MNTRWTAALAVMASVVTFAGVSTAQASSTNPDRDPCVQDPHWWDGTCDEDIQPAPPGERRAVGRDRDVLVAQGEAEAEADSTCFGDWSMVGHPDIDFMPNETWRYTLTYTCG